MFLLRSVTFDVFPLRQRGSKTGSFQQASATAELTAKRSRANCVEIQYIIVIKREMNCVVRQCWCTVLPTTAICVKAILPRLLFWLPSFVSDSDHFYILSHCRCLSGLPNHLTLCRPLTELLGN